MAVEADDKPVDRDAVLRYEPDDSEFVIEEVVEGIPVELATIDESTVELGGTAAGGADEDDGDCGGGSC